MKNVILADNQDITNAGLKFLLEKYFDVLEMSEVTRKTDLHNLLNKAPNSLVIIDYTLFDFENVSELIVLQSRYEQVDWIIFSDELSDDFLRTLLFNTQSFSVLLKDSTKEEICSAVREIIKGNRFICNHVTNLILDNSKGYNPQNQKHLLTQTEKEILKEMALGKSTKEIAALRYVSAHTIMTHRKNIFRKIEVNNVHEATKYAMRAGIVDLAEYYI